MSPRAARRAASAKTNGCTFLITRRITLISDPGTPAVDPSPHISRFTISYDKASQKSHHAPPHRYRVPTGRPERIESDRLAGPTQNLSTNLHSVRRRGSYVAPMPLCAILRRGFTCATSCRSSKRPNAGRVPSLA